MYMYISQKWLVSQLGLFEKPILVIVFFQDLSWWACPSNLIIDYSNKMWVKTSLSFNITWSNYKFKLPLFQTFATTQTVATLLWKSERMTPSPPKWGLESLPRLSKLQSSIVGVKTPRIKALFISLESYQSEDVENGLAWTIWTFVTQVMMKRKVGSQIGGLTPDH